MIGDNNISMFPRELSENKWTKKWEVEFRNKKKHLKNALSKITAEVNMWGYMDWEWQ